MPQKQHVKRVRNKRFGEAHVSLWKLLQPPWKPQEKEDDLKDLEAYIPIHLMTCAQFDEWAWGLHEEDRLKNIRRALVWRRQLRECPEVINLAAEEEEEEEEVVLPLRNDVVVID